MPKESRGNGSLRALPSREYSGSLVTNGNALFGVMKRATELSAQTHTCMHIGEESPAAIGLYCVSFRIVGVAAQTFFLELLCLGLEYFSG